jgi:hypothetical protein
MSSDMILENHSGHCITVTTGEPAMTDGETLTPELRDALQSVEQSIEDLNSALRNAMEAGATVEVRRRARVHSGDGCWADQMAPLVLPKSRH